MNESDRRIDRWAEQLRALAAPALIGTPLESGADRSAAGAFVGAFADAHGHKRAADRPLLARMLAVDPGTPPDDATPDVRLWWALHTPDANPWAIIDPGPGAPLLASRRRGIIETDTESELSALHALWHHAAERRCPRLLDRCLRAARSLIDETQPDNATGHPWAVHVFVMLAVLRDAMDAELYAQTLVHNALVGEGRVERFSACLLHDAAAALQRQPRIGAAIGAR